MRFLKNLIFYIFIAILYTSFLGISLSLATNLIASFLSKSKGVFLIIISSSNLYTKTSLSSCEIPNSLIQEVGRIILVLIFPCPDLVNDIFNIRI